MSIMQTNLLSFMHIIISRLHDLLVKQSKLELPKIRLTVLKFFALKR
jgi:hypothetical protein